MLPSFDPVVASAEDGPLHPSFSIKAKKFSRQESNDFQHGDGAVLVACRAIDLHELDKYQSTWKR